MSGLPDHSLKESVLSGIWDELRSLESDALDQFLISAGLDPSALVQDFDANAQAAMASLKRERFEEAKKRIRSGYSEKSFNVVSFDLNKKKAIFASIKELASKTNEMTIAARNEKLDTENDVDAFLEACVRLGMIDQDGNLLKK